MKRNRVQYKKNWAAASRTLRNAKATNTNRDTDEPHQLLFNPVSQDNTSSDTETFFEQNEPSPKHHRVSVLQHIEDTFQHEDNDLSVMGFDCNVSSSSEMEDDALRDISLSERLGEWSNQFLIKQNALDGLLKLLQDHGHPNLPSSARTLLKTAKKIPVQNRSGMDYIYFPLATEIMKHFKKYPAHVINKTESLQISLNVDGLPLFKSSNVSLWPVLCAIVNVKPITVFPVVLTCGASKPTNLDFLEDLITDLGHVLEHGLQDGNKVISVSLRCIVCDAPARAMIKGTKLCSGYFGCDKCRQKGLWVGRVVYPDTRNLSLRSDSSFRNQTDEEHHNGLSPFCNIAVDMVKKFPIDYMHQLCLGVMKKLILAWIRGKREVRISAGHVNEISSKLVGLKSYVPNIFARKPRSLAEIDRWKATEFRQFLLYTGKIVLDGILRPDLYNHFMCLSIASSIFVCPTLARTHLNYGKQLMEYFVEQAKILYGDEFIVYNVHSMVHLAAEVEEYGSLDACSAFPFENYMQKLKRLVRSGKSPLTQIAKRLSESSFEIPSCHEDNVSFKKPDNAYVLPDKCCEIVDKANPDENGRECYLCRVYERSEPLFTNPCDSRIIGVHKVNEQRTHMRVLSAESLKRKAIKVDLGPNKTAFMAILHST